MVVLFSAYALLRMQQRGIHPGEVTGALASALSPVNQGHAPPPGTREVTVGSLRVRYRHEAGRVVVVNAMRTPLSPR